AEVQMEQLLGAIVLGFAHLGLRRHAAALRAFQEVTAQSTLMRSILLMPLRLGLGQYWLARRQFGRAREQMQELCRLAATSGERRYGEEWGARYQGWPSDQNNPLDQPDQTGGAHDQRSNLCRGERYRKRRGGR